MNSESPEKSERPEDWKPIVERIIHQFFYRQLGTVALPCGMELTTEVIDMLCKEGKGTWRWLLENRVLLWEEIPINEAIKVHAYVFGSKKRQKNTVFVRQGFWRMYFFELGLRVLDVSVIGRILARV